MSDVGLLSPISVLTDDSFNQDPSVVRLKTPPPLPLPIPVWASKVIALLCGLVFGFALHKAGVYRAAVIIHQFYFSEFRMLKVRAGDGSARGRGWRSPFLRLCLCGRFDTEGTATQNQPGASQQCGVYTVCERSRCWGGA